jgi:aryl sulfotransferase
MASAARHRYRSTDEDSGRWEGFSFRPGDIVISTRSKSGTTWVQMVCALLVFETADLPAPLAELSPWLDWTIEPVDSVHARLAAQQHRRFIKTHTPLDGVPFDRRVTYVVVARHPLDAAVSLYHQGANLDRARLAELSGGRTAPDHDRPPLHEWLLSWIGWSGDPRRELDSLPGVMWHLGDAWTRRNEPNVVLVHYDDLYADLDGEMRRLATELGFVVDEQRWPALVEAARFDTMRAASVRMAPDPAGVLKDPTAFFRRGRPGAGREVLSPSEMERYGARAAKLAAPDLLAWVHHGRSALGDDRMGR